MLSVVQLLLILTAVVTTKALIRPVAIARRNAVGSWNPRASRLFFSTDDNNNNDNDNNNNDHSNKEEDARLRVLSNRRRLIRGVLRSAESLRNYRVQQQAAVPGSTPPETRSASNTKLAVSLTAFLVAAGAVILRVGGRAALVSALGLDFAQDNPELKETLQQFLNYSDSMDTFTKAALFIIAWTCVKVFCFDSGGIVLALSSGILFGGVLQGATLSALAATIGSTVAFYLTQIPTPFRSKALQLLDEYPALRGIQKVVSQDGFKTILTLRLAPVLPIPLGMYNYIYGLTNVTLPDFTAGIFLGSFKPYLLDSYLGYFGKQVVDGDFNNNPLSTNTANGIDAITYTTPTNTATNFIADHLGVNNMQDFILLFALGASVLIGTFASQLANDTWDSIQKEIQLDAEAARNHHNLTNTHKDSVIKTFLGWDLPPWIVGMQIAYQEADQRITDMIQTEYTAKVWNYTMPTPIPKQLDPALFLDSPEQIEADTKFNFVSSLLDGVALTPGLIGAFLKYSDPQFNDTLIYTNSTLNRIHNNINNNYYILDSHDTNNIHPTTNYTSTKELIASWKNILAQLREKLEQKIVSLDNPTNNP